VHRAHTLCRIIDLVWDDEGTSIEKAICVLKGNGFGFRRSFSFNWNKNVRMNLQVQGSESLLGESLT